MTVTEYREFDRWAKSHGWKNLGHYGHWTPDGMYGGLTFSYMAPIGDTKAVSVSCTLMEAEQCTTL